MMPTWSTRNHWSAGAASTNNSNTALDSDLLGDLDVGDQQTVFHFADRFTFYCFFAGFLNIS